ncbi:MAG: hypothetical protein ACREQK_06755, partial [Candidatus Binatia bacterium]
SKAPLSFAIQTPVAIGPIDEYAMVILVWAWATALSATESRSPKIRRRNVNGLEGRYTLPSVTTSPVGTALL